MECLFCLVKKSVIALHLYLYSFESWFDIDTIGSDAKNVVANEREQNILHMLHQVSPLTD